MKTQSSLRVLPLLVLALSACDQAGPVDGQMCADLDPEDAGGSDEPAPPDSTQPAPNPDEPPIPQPPAPPTLGDVEVSSSPTGDEIVIEFQTSDGHEGAIFIARGAETRIDTTAYGELLTSMVVDISAMATADAACNHYASAVELWNADPALFDRAIEDGLLGLYDDAIAAAVAQDDGVASLFNGPPAQTVGCEEACDLGGNAIGGMGAAASGAACELSTLGTGTVACALLMGGAYITFGGALGEICKDELC